MANDDFFIFYYEGPHKVEIKNTTILNRPIHGIYKNNFYNLINSSKFKQIFAINSEQAELNRFHFIGSLSVVFCQKSLHCLGTAPYSKTVSDEIYKYINSHSVFYSYIDDIIYQYQQERAESIDNYFN